MIKINDRVYDEYEVKVSWGEFTVYNHGEKRTGESPFILYDVGDAFIGLETTYSREMFETMELGKEEDVRKYLTDITFEDDDGWASILENGSYECKITKISENQLHLIFHISAHDGSEEFDISIDDVLNGSDEK